LIFPDGNFKIEMMHGMMLIHRKKDPNIKPGKNPKMPILQAGSL